MKSKDIGLLAVIAIVSSAAAIFASSLIIPSNDKTQTVEVVAPISSNFNEFTEMPSSLRSSTKSALLQAKQLAPGFGLWVFITSSSAYVCPLALRYSIENPYPA